MEGIITIVYDWKKSKLCAEAEDGGKIRFPNKLRTEEGVRYWIESLAPGKSGSWIAKGKIIKVGE